MSTQEETESFYESRRQELVSLRGGHSAGDLTNPGYFILLAIDLPGEIKRVTTAQEHSAVYLPPLFEKFRRLQKEIDESPPYEQISDSTDKKIWLDRKVTMNSVQREIKDIDSPWLSISPPRPMLCEYCPKALWRGGDVNVEANCLDTGGIVYGAEAMERSVKRVPGQAWIGACDGFERALISVADAEENKKKDAGEDDVAQSL